MDEEVSPTVERLLERFVFNARHPEHTHQSQDYGRDHQRHEHRADLVREEKEHFCTLNLSATIAIPRRTGSSTVAKPRKQVMKSLLLLTIMALSPSVGISPASAGNPCAHVGPTRELICVCKRNSCWLEVGTRHRFNMRFNTARAFTDAGVIGVWRPIRNK